MTAKRRLEKAMMKTRASTVIFTSGDTHDGDDPILWCVQ
jgi:hypothetical protein